MKPFRNRLARVLRLRRILEREALGTWGSSEAAARDGEAAREQAVGDVLGGLEATRERRASEQFSARDALADERAIDELRQRLSFRRAQAMQLRAQSESDRESWSAARADVESLERLEQRERERHRSESEREEQIELDERAGSRFQSAPQDEQAGKRPSQDR